MRWLLRIILVVMGVVVLATGSVLLVPSERIATALAQRISVQTGREVVFKGPFRPTFYPVLGLRVGGFRIANAPWGRGQSMLVADTVLIGFELLPLLRGKMHLRDFRLVNPRINLERGADGRANWIFTSARRVGVSRPAAGGKTASPVLFKNMRISGGSVRFRDRRANTAWQVTGVDLAFADHDQGFAASAKGGLTFRNARITYDATFDDPARLLSGGLGQFSLVLSAPFGAALIEGQAGFDPPQAAIRLEAHATDPVAAADFAAVSALPVGATGNRVDFKGGITYADNTVFLRDVTIGANGNRITGKADIDLTAKPLVRAKIDVGDLDLGAVLAGAAAPVGGETKGGGWWSTAPLDLGFLAAANGEMDFSANSINLGRTRLGTVRMKMRLDRARLVFVMDRLETFGGVLAGQLVINDRTGLSVGADVRARGIKLRALLADFAGYEGLTATAAGRLEFLTSGGNIDTMLRRLRGTGRLDVGPGEVLGLDLAGMLKTPDTSIRSSRNKTIFTDIKGSYSIDKGVLTNDDLTFAAPHVQATGQGRVDIGARTLDYRLRAEARLLRISGAWDDINITSEKPGKTIGRGGEKSGQRGLQRFEK